MKALTVLLVMMFVLMGASVAFAGCYQERLTDPRKFEFLGTNLDGKNVYLSLVQGGVNSNGNIHIVLTTFLGEPNGICQVGTVYEICCDRQEARVLEMSSCQDSDWPSDKDSTNVGNKIWESYSGETIIGRAANLVCGRKSQLPPVPPRGW